MQTMMIFVSAAAVLAAGMVVFYDRRRTERTMEKINAMLDEAINGDFLESTWDESLLSFTEAKLANYLQNAAVSARGLREQKAKIETLVADISHQTKTPISNILLYAQLLEEQDLPEEARMLAGSISTQSEKLRTLIEALVKTSRLETGVFQLQPGKHKVITMLEDAVEQFLPKAQRKQITLRLEPSEAEAVFDARWTAEAVGNLVDNAVKYTPESGEVSLCAAEYEMFCRIDVSDTGPGIPEDEKTRIFRRFYRSPAAAETEGVGLGLSLARQIISGQGGYITVKDRQDGGSVFSVFLPRD